MVEEWFAAAPRQLGFIAISVVVILLWAIAVIRVTGLRSLSKMSGFDFVVTVALGSIVASVAATSASLWHGALAFALLLGAQWAIAKLRFMTAFSKVVDNQPLLLMDRATVLDDNLRKARVTHEDLRAKLREANVIREDDLLAVVLETTGDVTVLHGEGPLDDVLLEGVRRS